MCCTGLQKDIDLPMIAVIGNQSARKPSLIESISGLTLPRLTFTESDWACVVNLHLNTEERGSPIRPRVLPFGEVLSSKSEVEERIRRAQWAILNPRMDPEIFLRGATVDEDETSFTRNHISLAISGRDLADLSFVDLPDLIANVGQSGRVHDIELPTSKIKYDPEGKRTVGVLMKPDRIPDGEEKSWVRLIRNEVEPLGTP
ncbi:hypothetical protein F5141DRAFT_1060052 [Pisolithus sp. B1]|nr:hypothetical protein F5141DRAFT_1060052 [Pisolithus sp. B1]